MFKMIYKWTDKMKDKVAELSAKLNEKGQGLTEYAIILAAVAVIAFVALYGSGTDGKGGLKEAVTNLFTTATTKVNAANNQ